MARYVLSDDPVMARRVRDILLREGEICPPEQVLTLDQVDQMARAHPGLVVLVLAPDPERALGVLDRVQQYRPDHILAVGPGGDSRLLLRALHAGTSDFVDEADLEADLRASLARLRAAGGERNKVGKVIALLGLGCGSGSSTLAVNLAVALARKEHTPLLIDLRFPLGDLAALLDLKPTHSVGELCQNAARMDRSMLERTLETHDSGVKLLAAPSSFADRAPGTAEGVREILHLARRMFSHVLVDVDPSLGPEQQEVLSGADVVFVVLHLQFTCLRKACRTLDYLERVGVPRERIRVVVNRHGQDSEVPVAKAEKVLGLPIGHYVPDDPRSINKAANDGVPVVLASPHAHASRSLVALAASLNGKAP